LRVCGGGVLCVNAQMDQADFWYEGYYRRQLFCISRRADSPTEGKHLPGVSALDTENFSHGHRRPSEQLLSSGYISTQHKDESSDNISDINVGSSGYTVSEM